MCRIHFGILADTMETLYFSFRIFSSQLNDNIFYPMYRKNIYVFTDIAEWFLLLTRCIPMYFMIFLVRCFGNNFGILQTQRVTFGLSFDDICNWSCDFMFWGFQPLLEIFLISNRHYQQSLSFVDDVLCRVVLIEEGR